MNLKLDPRTGRIVYNSKFNKINTASNNSQKKKDEKLLSNNFENLNRDNLLDIVSLVGKEIALSLISALKDNQSLLIGKNNKNNNLSEVSIEIDSSLIDVGIGNIDNFQKGKEAGKEIAKSHISEDKDLNSAKNKLRNLIKKV